MIIICIFATMIDYDLKKIRAIVLDVDGVLSASTVLMDKQGDPVRTINIKDGYALQLAAKCGLRLAIISGGHDEAITRRYNYLGISDVYLNCAYKVETWQAFLNRYGISHDEAIYMGDDIPDYEVMQLAGCPCCPTDAATDIKQVSRYISPYEGGRGCVRDVIEQVLRAQGLWMHNEKAFGW